MRDYITELTESTIGKWIAFIHPAFTVGKQLQKRFTVASLPSHSPIHTPTALSTMQGNNQHVRSSQG